MSFVPWEKVTSQQELGVLGEGGWIDPATFPPGMELPPKGVHSTLCKTPMAHMHTLCDRISIGAFIASSVA